MRDLLIRALRLVKKLFRHVLSFLEGALPSRGRILVPGWAKTSQGGGNFARDEGTSRSQLLGMVLNFVVVALIYRNVLGKAAQIAPPAVELQRPRAHRGLLLKSVAVTLATVGLFCARQPIALVALIAAAVLMLDHVRPEKVFAMVDWPLLVMFTGLIEAENLATPLAWLCRRV